MEKLIQQAMELAKQLEKRVRDVNTLAEIQKIIKDWYSEVEELGEPFLAELAYQYYSISRHQREIAQRQLASDHVVVAKRIRSKIIIVMGILSGLSIVGGIIATVWNIVSPTEFTIFGVKLTTGSVGVALVALGLFTFLFVAQDVLKDARKRDGAPDD